MRDARPRHIVVTDLGYIPNGTSSALTNVKLGTPEAFLYQCSVRSSGYSVGQSVDVEVYSKDTPGTSYESLRHVVTIPVTMNTNRLSLKRGSTIWTGGYGANASEAAMPIAYRDDDGSNESHFLVYNNGAAARLAIEWYYTDAVRDP